MPWVAVILASGAFLAVQDPVQTYLDTFEEEWRRTNALRDDDERDQARERAVRNLTGGPRDERIGRRVRELVEQGTRPRSLQGPRTLAAAAGALGDYPRDGVAAAALVAAVRALTDIRRIRTERYAPAIVAALHAYAQMERRLTRPLAAELFPLLDPRGSRDHPAAVTRAAVEALAYVRVKETIPPLLALMEGLQQDLCEAIRQSATTSGCGGAASVGNPEAG